MTPRHAATLDRLVHQTDALIAAASVLALEIESSRLSAAIGYLGRARAELREAAIVARVRADNND